MEGSEGGAWYCMNGSLSKYAIEELLRAGVKEWVLCPSARNAPMVQVLIANGLPLSFWPEERSASFYALGRAKRLKAPVACVVTSGTAAGELYPAVMEAYYSGVPLVAVTADRPRHLRFSGAPQAAIQNEMFGPYTPCHYDIQFEERFKLSDWDKKAPLHLNLCFDEPARECYKKVELSDSFYPTLQLPLASLDPLNAFFKRSKHPLVVVGALERSEQAAVFRFLFETQAPVYLEAPSGLREIPQLQQLRILNPVLEDFDGVLRIGGVPTHRLYRDLEEKKNLIEVLSISSQPFSGLSWSHHVQTDLSEYFAKAEGPQRSYSREEKFWDKQKGYREGLSALLQEEPRSEAALIQAFSNILPSGSHLYLGNSQPIRYWDLAATDQSKSIEITCSRGLNGIDGQIATFLGLSEKKRCNAALIGDLTALYDLAGLWGAYALQELSFTVCIVNNGGGKIFSGMFPEQEIQNPHSLQFEPIAKFWGLEYAKWELVPQEADWQGQKIIELFPDPQASERFKKRHKELVQELLVL